MKPSFALSLDHDGIRLLHRGRGGWVSVGEVALDDPDITERLTWLRKTAAGLAQGAVTTKLVIPNSEILYDRIVLKAGSDAKREAQLRGALDGRTPYPVDQLAYDYVVEGDVAQVAVVARETLVEAEAFATEHRFNPVCFVAIPPEDVSGELFDGEPMFGTTSAAKSLLDPSDPLERDPAPIRVVGSAKLPDMRDDAPVVDVPEALEETQDDAASADEAEVTLDPAAVAAELMMPGLPAADAPVTDQPVSDAVVPDVPASDVPTSNLPGPNLAGHDAPASDAENAEIAPKPEAEPATDAPAPSFFASRRARSAAPAAAEPVADAAPNTAAPDTTAPDLAAPEPPAARLRSRRSRLGFGATAPASDSAEPPASDAPARREPRFGAGPKIDAPAPEAPLSTAAPAPGQPSPAALARLASIVPNRKVAPAPEPGPQITAVADAPSPELLGLSRTGADLGNPAPLNKKRKPIGLILTGALLAVLLLGAVALMLFTDAPEQATFTPENAPIDFDASTAPLQTATVVPQPRLTLPDDATDASLPDPVTIGPDELDAAELADAEPTSPEALAEPELRGIDDDLDTPVTLPRVTLLEAEARFAETGAWTRSPDPMPQPVITGLEDLYLASLDPNVDALDAVALPGYVQGRDLRLVTPRPPVAPGQTYALDENGLVAPTAEGTLNPEGVRVRLAAAGTARPNPRPITDGPTGADAQPADENALAAFRPRARPDNAAELLERAELDGFSRAELAALRPRARPESEQAIASAAAVAAGASTAAVIGATPADVVVSSSALAVASSRNPTLRPSNIAQIVATARATVQPQATRVAVRAPTTAPQIPTRASVARQATIENAISLRQVNLIGVYGSPSDRRALVRLSNGRYVKVEVGDSVDGGQVAAIGESSLQYVKRGRNLTLSLPTEG